MDGNRRSQDSNRRQRQRQTELAADDIGRCLWSGSGGGEAPRRRVVEGRSDPSHARGGEQAPSVQRVSRRQLTPGSATGARLTPPPELATSGGHRRWRLGKETKTGTERNGLQPPAMAWRIQSGHHLPKSEFEIYAFNLE